MTVFMLWWFQYLTITELTDELMGYVQPTFIDLAKALWSNGGGRTGEASARKAVLFCVSIDYSKCSTKQNTYLGAALRCTGHPTSGGFFVKNKKPYLPGRLEHIRTNLVIGLETNGQTIHSKQ